MNYSKAIFLISDDARAIMVTYEAGDNAPRAMVKTLDPKIAVDDFVVVQTDTRHHMTVCKVVEVDVDVDFDTGEDIKWVIGSVAKADFDELKRQEEAAISKIKSAEKTKRKDELREALIKDVGGDMKVLAITTQDASAESPD